jgi:hypothetical protein
VELGDRGGPSTKDSQKDSKVSPLQASTRLGTSREGFALFGVALLLRLLFVSLTTITPISDAERYAKHAERLLDGEGFISDEGKPTAYTPPGYPFFLAPASGRCWEGMPGRSPTSRRCSAPFAACLRSSSAIASSIVGAP